ncbi:uncharacterized protein LY79DRAFT_528907 [Colletotrichum navitas]|uniref:DUF6546 domain-containing protein n=1 Tax=Colletotrichum navitas TaxID=681940 RepID=A0AAD8UY35_9PEZI|nr:uncharacterized protein LY79DRAFT_528907 [Colletotrichum navitas]KAK1566389.1 hypothetical protein LY79DRAFT_528907 [Colletotrichum navitas]
MPLSTKTSWGCLPSEIRLIILEVLLQDGCSLARLATVSREWQAIIERHNFARIKLTPSRLANFNSMIHRNQALVSYIWLSLELQEYDCTRCAPNDLEEWGDSNTDNILIVTAIQDLFSSLSSWKPYGSLVLDISVYSPSDSKHWFKYLTFGPDISSGELKQDRHIQKPILSEFDDTKHGWIAGSQESHPSAMAMERVFDEIMGEGPFDDDEQENQWWLQLPLVPVVTGVLLRQQSRRRWKPKALSHMFSRFSRLQEIHYEPWMEWDDAQQMWTDESYRSLFKQFSSYKLRRLVVFENFNQRYRQNRLYCAPIRIPTLDVSQTLASATLEIEHLSASFIVDAGHFFSTCKPSWGWPNLISLTLTSQLLTPDESTIEINDMLQGAAIVAMRMPNLQTMEIWNGRKGLAALFKYQSISYGGYGQRAEITWRGTWGCALNPSVIRAWEAEFLDVGVVKSHGDAVYYLNLSNTVIRPLSLQQIRMENRIVEGAHDW